jgi:predicted phosphoribosyltransferase
VRFADLADGGRRLAPLIEDRVRAGALVVSVGEGGRVTGTAVAAELGVDVAHLETSRDDAGVQVDVDGVALAGRDVVVVDDGVETGTAAVAAARAVREAGAVSVVLAVPVCPREAESRLRPAYDDVVAVVRPLVRRSLRWHYETFA